MATLTESKQSDFVVKLHEVLEQNAQLFIDKGVDPVNVLAELKTQSDAVATAEAKDLSARAAAKDATREANEVLKVAYESGSKAVDFAAGVLGKKHSLIVEIKKMRKTYGSRSSDSTES